MLANDDVESIMNRGINGKNGDGKNKEKLEIGGMTDETEVFSDRSRWFFMVLGFGDEIAPHKRPQQQNDYNHVQHS